LTETLREKGLNGFITGSGGNLSAGEKQLICIIRALLKKSKIVLIDEATSNIDPKTDKIIQTAMREFFKDSTVLTIAHRIDTIIDSDKILVMKDGRMAEFDKPSVLLENPKSLFYSLYHESMRDSELKGGNSSSHHPSSVKQIEFETFETSETDSEPIDSEINSV